MLEKPCRVKIKANVASFMLGLNSGLPVSVLYVVLIALSVFRILCYTGPVSGRTWILSVNTAMPMSGTAWLR